MSRRETAEPGGEGQQAETEGSVIPRYTYAIALPTRGCSHHRSYRHQGRTEVPKLTIPKKVRDAVGLGEKSLTLGLRLYEPAVKMGPAMKRTVLTVRYDRWGVGILGLLPCTGTRFGPPRCPLGHRTFCRGRPG
jgi:hypothetical protein